MSTQNEKKHKHLEFIQLAIARMNVNSFLVKGWLMTLVAAIFVLSQKEANTKYLWFAPFSSILFWILDGFFLNLERRYRSLYDDVRILDESQIDYSMDISRFQDWKNSYFGSLLSITLLLFYPLIIVASILGASFLNK